MFKKGGALLLKTSSRIRGRNTEVESKRGEASLIDLFPLSLTRRGGHRG
jgi:hypothetical protein